MAINKVVYNGGTLIDLTGDTVTADTLMQGYTAHDKTGAIIIGTATGGSEQGTVWQDGEGYVHLDDESGISLQTKSATPSETAQTITADEGYYALQEVNVGAISSSYVGSGITRRSSSDLTVSGATVTAPSGYYSASASKSVASGTAGSPTATKGTVSNHSVSITPSVTNTTGYITGGTKSGTAVSVSASELVSGTLNVTSSGTKDVTNYASASIPSGTEGTPTATKGTVSNHSVSVTPSVTNTTGYITGGTKTGTAVSVSASELVSGTLSVTSSGTKDVTNYASASIPSGTEGTPTATKGTVSDHTISVTPSVTNTSGFITGSTKTGTAVSVSASELVSGTLEITENGTGIDVTNYASVDVNVDDSSGMVELVITPTSETQIILPSDVVSKELLYTAKEINTTSGSGSGVTREIDYMTPNGASYQVYVERIYGTWHIEVNLEKMKNSPSGAYISGTVHQEFDDVVIDETTLNPTTPLILPVEDTSIESFKLDLVSNLGGYVVYGYFTCLASPASFSYGNNAYINLYKTSAAKGFNRIVVNPIPS